MKRFSVAALVLCLIATLSPQAPQRSATRESFLPVSVWYAGGKARAPMLEPVTADSAQRWKEDLLKIKSLGFNTVRTWVEWTSGEPREGEYHLEQLDLMLKLAQEVGLKVFVQVYVDSAPDWVGEKYPDAHFVAQSGQAIPSQSAPGFCTDHPGVRQAVLDFYKQVAQHAAKSPAFFGWDLWSEPHVINWAEINYIPNAQFCYCPYTLARFRSWLKSKYGTLDNLNHAWYRQFYDWKQVEPPRFDTILSYTDYVDWRVFITDKLAADLKMRNDAVKSVAPEQVTTSHSAVPGLFTSMAEGDGSPDDWLMYRSVDYYGVSLYPKHSLPPHWSVNRLTSGMDFTRSAGLNRGFYVGELQAGFGVRGDVVSQPITPQDIQMYMWGAVARGARGINVYAFYPMSSGYESGGYGLIDLDGTLTDRSKAAGATAKLIDANSDLLLKSRVQQPEVAILFNHLTTIIGGAQHLYNPAALYRSTSGYYRMFAERNIGVDFISARQLDPAQLKQYKLVVAPYPILLESNVANALEQYVRDGGRLFVEARPGWVNERGYAEDVVPGFGWAQMLGVRENSVTPRQELNIKWRGEQFLGSGFEEHFTVLDPAAKVLAYFDDGSPAAYEKAYSKGSAAILGTFAGQINETKPTAMHPLGAYLVKWAGISSPDLKWTAPLELKQLIASNGRFVFLFNWGAEPAQATFATQLDQPAKKVREVISGQEVAPSGTKLQVTADVPANSVRIFRVDY